VVLCLSPAGEVLREIAFPTRIPASVMFFGPELDRLFVPTIDPSFLGRERRRRRILLRDRRPRRAGLPEPRYRWISACRRCSSRCSSTSPGSA
jgi:hypothetical protein